MRWLADIDTFLFDLDGTLTVPVIDFPALRRDLGLPEGVSIVHALDALAPKERAAKEAVVRKAEIEAAEKTRQNDGAVELIAHLRAQGHASAVITRNHREAAFITLDKLKLEFAVVLTRECVANVKPAPDPALEALKRLERKASRALMVGDWIDDIRCGQAAGTKTCLVSNGRELPEIKPDLTVKKPRDLLKLLRPE